MFRGEDIYEEPYAFSSDEEQSYNRTNNRHQKNSFSKKPSRKLNNSAVSLLDFDRDYSSKQSLSRKKVKVHPMVVPIQNVFQKCSRWVATTSLFKLGVVGLALGLLCAITYHKSVQLYQKTVEKGNQNSSFLFVLYICLAEGGRWL